MKKHVYDPTHNNNRHYFDKGVIINDVKFNDFSSYSGLSLGPVFGTILPPTSSQNVDPSNKNIQNTLQSYSDGSGTFDHMNKIVNMLLLNWNGAEIIKGDFEYGDDYEISTTPEFLSIFNNVTSSIYTVIAKYISITNKIKRQTISRITTESNMTFGPNETYGNYRIYWDIIEEYTINNLIISNTTNHEILITVNQGTYTTSEHNTLEFKTPSGSGLYVMIRPYGFGEISFLRLGNKIYARGI